MGQQEKNIAWEVLSSTTIFKNQYVSLREDDVQTPQGDTLTWWTIERPDAAAILPLTDNGDVILIGGYRHPIGRFLWEVPAGLQDPDDNDLLATAQRELQEETGITAKRWQPLARYPVSAGGMRQDVEVFLARDLSFGDPRPDDSEHLVQKRLSLDEAIAFSHEQGAVSGSTMIALYRTKELLAKEQQ